MASAFRLRLLLLATFAAMTLCGACMGGPAERIGPAR